MSRDGPTEAEGTAGPPPAGGTGRTLVDGRALGYRRAGTEGPPVVLLHGGGIDDATLSWKYTLGALADDHQVYAPDWPGYGDSAPLDGDHSNDRYVEVLREFLRRLDLDRVTLVGLSMGGAAALGYALASPERVDRLVLVDSYGLGEHLPIGSFWYLLSRTPGVEAGWKVLDVDDTLTRSYLSSVVADGADLDDGFVREVRERAGRTRSGRAFTDYLRNEVTASGHMKTNFVPRLSEVRVPTHVIHGTEDGLFPPAWGERAAERIPGAGLTMLDGVGHWPTREAPERFDDLLVDLLDGDLGVT